MKKAIALLMCLLLCAGVAQAAQWREGTAPSHPYAGMPEADLSKEFGYIMLYPNEAMPLEHCGQKLLFYTPREDVEAADATFYLCTESKKNGAIWSTKMNNADVVTVRPITEDELTGLLWGGGTCFEVLLPETLVLGQSYFVNMEEGCIVSKDGVKSPTIGSTDKWAFTLEGEYGVSAMQYRRAKNGGYEEGILHPQSGDEVRFELVLGGEATTAILYRTNDSIDFAVTFYEESCEVVGQVTGEEPVWGVLFLDGEGNQIDRIEF